MTYEQFILDLWRELKRMAFEPVFSLGEVVLIVAILALKLPWWIGAPLFMVWIFARSLRRDNEPKT